MADIWRFVVVSLQHTILRAEYFGDALAPEGQLCCKVVSALPVVAGAEKGRVETKV